MPTKIHYSKLLLELAPKLSHHDLISTQAPPRWSTFEPPRPAVVVDAILSRMSLSRYAYSVSPSCVDAWPLRGIKVKYCADRGIPFVAQNGGSGWATTFDLGTHGVLINLARLNQVTFNADRTRATIGGGARVNETIAHASAAGALVETGNCNCVGPLGAILGGGYGNLMGLYGFGVDNVVSVRVVTADGQVRDNGCYINFAHGDEPLEVVYGNSLPRLRAIKRRVDPKDNFNQWFNIRERKHGN
ncbi:FAD binding domain-containing protein [Apiospora aurea]|uniref:FAD binding domain-containing protein n=1 Tax=Apiospora aurea TaxID=335848 RepID=A0ABR1Q7M1_9PEZI